MAIWTEDLSTKKEERTDGKNILKSISKGSSLCGAENEGKYVDIEEMADSFLRSERILHRKGSGSEWHTIVILRVGHTKKVSQSGIQSNRNAI